MNKTLQKDVKINTKKKNHIKKKTHVDSLKGVIEQNKNKAGVYILELMVLAIVNSLYYLRNYHYHNLSVFNPSLMQPEYGTNN